MSDIKELVGKTIKSIDHTPDGISIYLYEGVVAHIEAPKCSIKTTELSINRKCLGCIWFRHNRPNPCTNGCNCFATDTCEGRITQAQVNEMLESSETNV